MSLRGMRSIHFPCERSHCCEGCPTLGHKMKNIAAATPLQWYGTMHKFLRTVPWAQPEQRCFSRCEPAYMCARTGPGCQHEISHRGLSSMKSKIEGHFIASLQRGSQYNGRRFTGPILVPIWWTNALPVAGHSNVPDIGGNGNPEGSFFPSLKKHVAGLSYRGMTARAAFELHGLSFVKPRALQAVVSPFKGLRFIGGIFVAWFLELHI